MRILIVNDDGVGAEQLLPLIRWCRSLGEVTAVVPKFEQSGKSHGIELHRAFEAKQVELEPGIREDQVIAIVTFALRKGKPMSPGFFWWEFFEKIWIRMVPLRRFVWKAYSLLR